MANKTERFGARLTIELDESAWNKFAAMLEQPVSHKPRLAELLAEASVFDGPSAGV